MYFRCPFSRNKSLSRIFTYFTNTVGEYCILICARVFYLFFFFWLTAKTHWPNSRRTVPCMTTVIFHSNGEHAWWINIIRIIGGSEPILVFLFPPDIPTFATDIKPIFDIGNIVSRYLKLTDILIKNQFFKPIRSCSQRPFYIDIFSPIISDLKKKISLISSLWPPAFPFQSDPEFRVRTISSVILKGD